MYFLKPTKLAVLSAVGLSLSAILGVPEIAKSAPDCGPGNHWVDTCQPGIDTFPVSSAYLELLIEGQSNPINLVLQGPASVTRETPVDALIGDPDFANLDVGFGLGNVGVVDGHIGVIKTTLEESFTGSGITLTGIGNGAIIEATESGIPNPDLAWSFFDVFATIEGSFGKARNMSSVTVFGDRWLRFVPPDDPLVLSEPHQLPPPPLPIPGSFNFDTSECNAIDPLAAIIYCGFNDVEFFLVDDDDNFILDQEGNKIRVATLLREAHVVPPPVPEPSATVSLALLGLAGLWGLKKQHSFEQN